MGSFVDIVSLSKQVLDPEADPINIDQELSKIESTSNFSVLKPIIPNIHQNLAHSISLNTPYSSYIPAYSE